MQLLFLKHKKKQFKCEKLAECNFFFYLNMELYILPHQLLYLISLCGGGGGGMER